MNLSPTFWTRPRRAGRFRFLIILPLWIALFFVATHTGAKEAAPQTGKKPVPEQDKGVSGPVEKLALLANDANVPDWTLRADYAPSSENRFFQDDFLRRNFWYTAGFPLIFLITVCAFLLHLLSRRKKEFQKDEFFRLTLASVGDAVLTTDALGRVNLLNPAAERLIGRTMDQVRGMPHEEVFRIVSALDDSTVPSPLTRALSTGETVELGNHTDLLSFDGKRYHIADCASPIRDQGGAIIGAVLIFRDVTEEYRHREELRRVVALWTAAATVANLQSYRMNIKTRQVFGNLETLNDYWPIQDGIAVPGNEWIVPEDAKTSLTAYQETLDGKTDSFTFVHRAVKNGQTRYYRQYGHIDPNNPEMLIGLIQDITAFKEAELERNAAQNLWAQVVDVMPIMLFVKSADDDFRYIQCNSNFGKFIGRAPAEIIGHCDAEFFDRPRDMKWFQDWDRKIMAEGKPQEVVEYAQGAGGRMFHFRTVKIPFKDAAGRSILVGMSIDITDLVNQRERLTATNAQLETGCRLTRSFTYQLDPNTRVLSAIGLFADLWPHQDGRPLPEEEWILPEDYENSQKEICRLLDGEISSLTTNFRTDWFGRRRYYRAALTAEQNDSGERDIYGVTQDVTELVENAHQLEDNALMWKSVMDELPVLFFVKDVNNDLRYLMCNRSNAEFLGLPAEEVIGKTTQQISTRSVEIDAYLNEEHQILQEEAVNKTRVNLPDATGLARELEKIEMPIFGKSGARLLVGIAFDITEREQSLRLAEISARILSEIVVESDFRKVLHIIGRSVIDILSSRRVLFAECGDDGLLRFLLECDSDQRMRFADGPVPEHEKVWNSYLDRLSQNEILCFDRMGDDEALLPFCQRFPEYHDIALALVPVCLQGKLSEVMIVTFYHARHFSELDTKTLRTISDCIQIAKTRDLQNRALLDHQRAQARQLAERTTLNDCLSVFMDSDYMNVPFEQILEIIRRHLGASYCYVLRIDPERRVEIGLAEAAAPGSDKFIIGNPPIPFNPAELWYKELCREQLVAWSDVTTDEARKRLDASWRRIADERHIRSLWVAALTPGGKMWGTFGIVYDEQSPGKFSVADESLVRAAARLVSLILMRSRSRDRLIQTRDQLAVALKQAQSAERAKSFFLASMSHEIRTPLNAVIGFAELLQDPTTDRATRDDYLENISISGNALLQLINDILDLSKLEADQMPIFPEPTDFALLADEVIQLFTPNVRKKNLKLEQRISPLPTLELDKMRIRQILFNIIGNAVKFTPSGSITLSAEFSPTDNATGVLTFSVADTGIGISQADRERLTVPFVQLSKLRGTNAANNGTGLGLAICKRMAEKMEGKIRIDSEEGHGSTFTFTLTHVAYGMAIPASPAAENPPQRDLSGVSVLLVDDVAVNLKVMTALCKRAGVSDIQTATSGAEALALMEQKIPRLVMTDLWMSDMNGAQLTERIRKDPRFAQVKVVAVTADVEAKENFPLRQFSDVFLKPVTPEKLKALFLSIAGESSL